MYQMARLEGLVGGRGLLWHLLGILLRPSDFASDPLDFGIDLGRYPRGACFKLKCRRFK